MNTKLTPSEDVELTLIQQDANDLIRALLWPRQHPAAGILAFPTMGLVGLVTEESFQYLSKTSPKSALRAPNPELFRKFGLAVTKVRARIKLFDDTDGYADGLIEALAIAHVKSVEWFCAPHRGFLRSWIRRLQPDLGIFFADENLIATTHTILPAVGLSLQELKSLTPTVLNTLGKRLFTFTYEVGIYFNQLAAILEPFGKHIELQPKPLTLEGLRLSYNDFVGAKAYQVAIDALRPTEERLIGAVIMAIAQINAALHVLPRLLTPQSNLLIRIQFLTVYHARNVLQFSVPDLMTRMPSFSQAERDVLFSRPLRNTCAHYGLRGAAGSAIGAQDPFGVAIHTLTSTNRNELCALLERWLNAASTTMAHSLSKSRLASAKAWLGQHS